MKSILRLSALVAAFLLATSASASEKAPQVRVKQGVINGVSETTSTGTEIFSFYNIPFAKPPLGDLRFKDPVPPEPWTGIRDGSQMPSKCYQHPIGTLLTVSRENVSPEGSEDCLYLNVFTAQPNNPAAKRPVMVFIHGGAFIAGAASYYSPRPLLEEDIVVVVLQYRLGVFGFLSTEDAAIPGNMGLKDQQMALKWIQDNIDQFGGDPQSVTIFGNSAGAASVHYQILSPASKGLFKRAIAMSGSALCPWAWSEGHRKFAQEAGEQFGCSLSDDSEKYLKCMQAVDPSELVEIAAATQKWGMAPLYVLPRVDGVFLPEKPMEIMKKGNYNKVDLIAGKTKDEGIYSMMMLYSDASMITNINDHFDEYGPISLYLQNEPHGVELASEVYKFYLQQDNISIQLYDEKLLTLLSDSYFGEAIDLLAKVHAGDKATTTYTYSLDHPGKGTLSLLVPGFENRNWVSHADELFYLFSGGPTFAVDMKGEDLMVREHIINLWTNFAKTGKPTPPHSIFEWEPVTPSSFRHLSILPSPKMEDDDFEERRELWRRIRNKQIESWYSGKRESSERKGKEEL